MKKKKKNWKNYINLTKLVGTNGNDIIRELKKENIISDGFEELL